MTQDNRTVVDMHWLANGEQDPHPDYIKRQREDLMGAHKLSDDELAYQLAMMSTISEERDTMMMIESHRTGGDYIPKSVLGEMAKDRIRWLSRKVAVLEGRYPGVSKPVIAVVEPKPVNEQEATQQYVAQARLERQVPLLVGWLGLTDKSSHIDLVEALKRHNVNVDPVKVGIAVGFVLNQDYTNRWHVYVTLARDLLKQGVYIPFFDDEYRTHRKSSKVLIVSSKYFKTMQPHEVRILVAPSTSVITDPVEAKLQELADLCKERKVTLDFWKEPGEHGWFSNWTEGGWCLNGLIDHLLEDIAKTDQEVIIEGDANDNYDVNLDTFAELIYDTWKDQEGFVAWSTRGNSLMQDKARKEAYAALKGE